MSCGEKKYENTVMCASMDARDKRILDNAQLVKWIVRRIVENLPPHIQEEDLLQVGYLGLIDAADRFSEGSDSEFRAYATCRIRGQIMDDLRKRDILTRSMRDRVDKLKKAKRELQHELMRDPSPEEVSRRLDISMDDFYQLECEARAEALISMEDIICKVAGVNQYVLEKMGKNDLDPEVETQIVEVRNILVDEIDKLSDKERMVVSLYYYDEITLREIGEVLGVTESRISQVHAQAIIKLERRLKTSLDSSM